MITIIFIILFVVFSAFFSASETALFSLRATRLQRLQAKYPRAKTLKYLLRRPSLLLSTIVFGNMLVNIGLASLTTALFVALFQEKGVLVSIAFSGIVILFFGEVLPKTLSIYLADRISLFSAPILTVLINIFFPIVLFLQKISDRITLFFIKPKTNKVSFTEEELRTVLLLGMHEGSISKAEEEMISYVLKFKDTHASQIMTPRTDVKAINSEASTEEVQEILRSQWYSKFPVYKESMDNISGVLYAKEVFLHPDENWKHLIKEVPLVPESKKIDDILTIFIKNNERIAVVLDEYGGTAGIVTFEDIVEEIVGEIYDEFESPQELIEKIDEKTYRVSGKMPIKTFNLELATQLSEDEDTIAGYLLSRLERIPRVDEECTFERIQFVVEKASRKRILSVIAKLS